MAFAGIIWAYETNTARGIQEGGQADIKADTCAIITDDVLDTLLDQEGLEIDGVDRMERDTPLHKAVRHVNELGKDNWAEGHPIVDILLDAGCDPR